MKRNHLKIILPAFLAILLFILTIFLFIIPRFQQNIINGKREMIKELTNSAWSILSKYENDERDGLMTREEAQKKAISRIQYLRYGEENKDYFWITDTTPTMIMHPFRIDLNGTDLTSFTDPHGKRLFVEFVETVKKSGQGYVDYMWQWKDDSLHIVPKLSYVKIFKPWQWVIGTGVYIEDVKKEIALLTKRMIWISIGISLIIAFLLLYILKQSLIIEQKRIRAENELHESREKYRTLVEAASEGLLMLIDGKISFSNNVISKMTGYKTSELNNLSLLEIISKSNNNAILETFSKTTVKEGKYELNLQTRSGDLVNVLVTSSMTEFYGKTVNIIIAKDISLDKSHNTTRLDYQKLISTLNVGFFKASIDSKGKFIYANETTLKILGFDSFEALSKTHILQLLAETDDRKNLRESLIENGFLKNKVLKISKKKGGYAIIAVSLVLLNNGNTDELICDGIIEDITVQENNKIQISSLIAQLKAGNFILEQPVKTFVAGINTMDADSVLNDVINFLSKRNTDNVLLTKNGNDIIGIITNTDIQTRILPLKLKLDNPAYLIMSSPVAYISENTSIFDAISICEEKKISHLVVRDESDEVTGMLRINDVYRMMKKSLSFIVARIREAETTDALEQCYHNLQLLIKPLIKSEVSVQTITKVTTSFSDDLMKRLIELSINETGQPPVRFSFICMGSEGRQEETLFTDQDNAIIYEDVPIERERDVNAYFLKLGDNVCNALNAVGYSFCRGNIMAKNAQWCKPLNTWENYFIKWIKTPEPVNLLDASIFFDFRSVYGDESFAEALRRKISIAIKENPLFLYHLAYNTCIAKPQHISSGNILSDRSTAIIDLKSSVIPIIMFARTYALQNNIWHSNTLERLFALKERTILGDKTAAEIIYVYNFLMKLRFRNQVDLSENNLPLSNSLNTKNMIELEINSLKKVLSAIPDFQNIIKTDFSVTT
jgi:PAS domain S-box-containing protein